jgi:hypothetical protein
VYCDAEKARLGARLAARRSRRGSAHRAQELFGFLDADLSLCQEIEHAP